MKPGGGNLAEYAEARTVERLRKLVSNLRRVREHPGNPDSIHDLRVSIRRFSQCLRVFQDLFERKQVKGIRRELRELMDRCAAVRNYDVGMEVLAAAAAPASLKHSFRRRRSKLERELSEFLEHWRLRRATRTWKSRLRPQARRTTAGALARDLLPAMAREFFRTGAGAARPGTNPREMHRFRLLTKRFRYAVELFEPVYGPEWERGLRELRGLQERLGTINDCTTTRSLLAGRALLAAGAARSSSQGRSRAAIERLLRERVEDFRVYWRRNFPRGNQTWWLDWLGAVHRSPQRSGNSLGQQDCGCHMVS